MLGPRCAIVVVASIALSLQGASGAAVRDAHRGVSPTPCVAGEQLVGAAHEWRDHDVSGINLALTNRSSACTVEATPSIEFFGSKGGGIGPEVYSTASSTRTHVIPQTFQVLDVVRLTGAPSCQRTVDATVILIDLGTKGVSVGLKAPEPICVAPQLNAVLAAPVYPRPIRCTAMQLRARLGGTQGASQILYTTIWFENVSKAACTISGFPSVQAVNGPGGDALGPPAEEAHPPGSGQPVIDLSHTGAQTHSTYAQAEPFLFARGSCEAQHAQGISVGILGHSPIYLAHPVEVCTKLNSTRVFHVGVWAP